MKQLSLSIVKNGRIKRTGVRNSKSLPRNSVIATIERFESRETEFKTLAHAARLTTFAADPKHDLRLKVVGEAESIEQNAQHAFFEGRLSEGETKLRRAFDILASR